MTSHPENFPIESPFKAQLSWLKTQLSNAFSALPDDASIAEIELIYDAYICVTRSPDYQFSVLQSYKIRYDFNEILKKYGFALASPTHIDICKIQKIRQKFTIKHKKRLLTRLNMPEKQLEAFELQYGDCGNHNSQSLTKSNKAQPFNAISREIFLERQRYEKAVKSSYLRGGKMEIWSAVIAIILFFGILVFVKTL